MQDGERQQLFEALLSEAHHAAALVYAARLARTRDEADDLLQDALLLAYRRLHQLRDRTLFKPWLLAIVRNTARSGFRRSLPPLCDSAWFQHSVPGPQAAEATELALALSSLPVAQQELLSLFYLDGLTLEETGRVLGIAPQAVGQRLFRARAALRRIFEARPTCRPAGEGQVNEAT